MPPPLAKVRLAARLLASEGAAALVDRLLDEAAYARRRVVPARRFDLRSPDLQTGSRSARAGEHSVLLYLATPPRPSYGGIQVVTVRWLDAARARRPVALLFRQGTSRYRLELTGLSERRSFLLDVPPAAPGDPLRDTGFERAVRWAARRTGARACHVLGLAGTPLASLRTLASPELRLVLSVHDFSAFCFRPHLLEQPALHFCEYSRDLERCGRCLRWDLPVDGLDQAQRRATAAELFRAAAAVAFPSRFLRRTHRELFSDALPNGGQVVPPARPAAAPVSGRPPRAVRRVAFVGGARAHKGGELLPELARRLVESGRELLVIGGGDPEILEPLSAIRGVRSRGYYRYGALPELLRRERVDVALLLSIVPESYCLTLDECRAAGVPVVAFDSGALGERLRAGGGGVPVPLDAGIDGAWRAIEAVERGDYEALDPIPARPPEEEDDDWLALYEAVLAAAPLRVTGSRPG